VNAGKPWYVAVYGRYNSRAEAQQAIGNLPTQLLVKQKPWVRSFDNIQTAIKART
jgi:septal ring-binding cell division protein DamX